MKIHGTTGRVGRISRQDVTPANPSPLTHRDCRANGASQPYWWSSSTSRRQAAQGPDPGSAWVPVEMTERWNGDNKLLVTSDRNLHGSKKVLNTEVPLYCHVPGSSSKLETRVVSNNIKSLDSNVNVPCTFFMSIICVQV